MDTIEHDQIRKVVRENYAKAAGAVGATGAADAAGCGCSSNHSSGCCSVKQSKSVETISMGLGYSRQEVETVPEGSNLGLGCGNPQAIAMLKAGEIVLDLGCGGGFDCFLASNQVGKNGQVIGVDMTPAMVSKARNNVVNGGYENIDIRLGEIENLPVADNSVDVIISNCVINLSPDKSRVFGEAFRVLKTGGRLAISDVVTYRDLPREIRENLIFYTSCVAGASSAEEIEKMLKDSGFSEICITLKKESAFFIQNWVPGMSMDDYVVSADIHAIKTHRL